MNRPLPSGLRFRYAVLLATISFSASAQTNFGPLAVGSTATATVTLSIPSAATVSGIAVLTQGAPNLDFTNAGGGTCATGATYAANATCTVKVSFSPGYPGARYGAVVLQQSGSVAATAFLQGSGIGPQLQFLPLGEENGIDGGGSAGVAMDGLGNLYVGGSLDGAVYKETPTAKGYVQSTIATGFQDVTGVALDGAGNVYFEDTVLNEAYKETPNGHGWSRTTVASVPTRGFSGYLNGIAVDGSGNVYIADDFDGEILKETPSGDGFVQSILLPDVPLSFGIAVTASGVIFVTSPNRDVVLVETPGANGTYTESQIGNGFTGPYGVAVDGLGDVFISDSTGLYEELLRNGAYTQLQILPSAFSEFGTPQWIAVDQFGDLFVAQRGITEIGPPNLGAWDFEWSTMGVPGPYGLTFGVTDIGNEPLKLSEVSYSIDFPQGPFVRNPFEFLTGEQITGFCGAGQTLEAGGACELSIDFLPISPLNGKSSIQLTENLTVASNSLNAAGNIQSLGFTGTENRPWTVMNLTVSADPSPENRPVMLTAAVWGTADSRPGSARISIVPTGTVGFYLESSPYTPFATVTLNSSGVATYNLGVQPVGTYSYFVSYSGDGNFAPTSGVGAFVNVVAAPSLSVSNAVAGTVNVGASATAVPVTVTFDKAETLGSIAVVMQGVANLDFTDAGGGTCITGRPYAARDTCTVNVAFTPRAPGTRYGAVVLSDAGGNVIGTGYVQGVGIGPQAAFSPGTRSGLLGPNLYPQAVAADASGNIYSLNSDGNLAKFTYSNGKYTQSMIGPVYGGALGFTVDGSGSVYVYESGEYGVSPPGIYKETLSNGAYTQTAVIGYGLTSPNCIAVDGAGNIYVDDVGEGIDPAGFYKETPSNGGYVQRSINLGLEQPTCVAVDGSGNLYVTAGLFNAAGNYYTPSLFKLTPSKGGYTKTVIGGGWVDVSGVAVDAIGNVYVIAHDVGDAPGTLTKETPQPDGTYVQSAILSNLNYPQSVAVDGFGNVYYTDGNIYKLDYADPPAFSFATTAVGSTSSDSPKTVTLTNSGTAPLTFPIPVSGTNPGITADFTLASSGASACPLVKAGASAPGTLAAGASCALPVSFAPSIAGSLDGSLTLTDNSPASGFGSAGIQSISLSGTATGKLPSPAVAWATPTAITYGVALGATQLNATSQVAGSFAYSPSAGTVLGAGPHTLSVTFTPTQTASYSAVTNMVTLAVNPAVLTVTAKNATRTYGAANPPLSATISGFVNGDTAAKAIGGAPELTLTAGPGSAAGGYPITPSAGSLAARNYSFNFVPGTLTIAKAQLKVTATNASVVYGKPLPTFTFTAAGFVNGDTVKSLTGAPSETTSAKQGSLPAAYRITIGQGTLSSANYKFAFTNGTLTITSAGQTAKPTFTPSGKTYSSPQSVTIADATPSATIYYKLDGTTPATTSRKYSGAINVSKTETIKAIAVARGYTESAVASAAYTIQ